MIEVDQITPKKERKTEDLLKITRIVQDFLKEAKKVLKMGPQEKKECKKLKKTLLDFFYKSFILNKTDTLRYPMHTLSIPYAYPIDTLCIPFDTVSYKEKEKEKEKEKKTTTLSGKPDAMHFPFLQTRNRAGVWGRGCDNTGGVTCSQRLG